MPGCQVSSNYIAGPKLIISKRNYWMNFIHRCHNFLVCFELRHHGFGKSSHLISVKITFQLDG